MSVTSKNRLRLFGGFFALNNNIETQNQLCYTENMNKQTNTFINQQEDILQFLLSNQDDKYREFTSSLIPTVDKSNIIGVRTPIIRKLAKALKDTDMATKYLSALPHQYLEQNHLHGFLIENVRDFDLALSYIYDFLPYIDNWATCDTVRPKVFKTNTDKLYEHICKWLKSNDTYTVRYAIGLLHSFYLDEHFEAGHLRLVSSIDSEQYYVNMMIAWYFATALSKQYDTAITYIENRILNKWTHNKTIQKACESYRIDSNVKAYLRTLKIK